MKTVVDLTREAGIRDCTCNGTLGCLERFAELVRADERTANIGCIGRIAAMVGDPIDQARLYEAMDAIRARGRHDLF